MFDCLKVGESIWGRRTIQGIQYPPRGRMAGKDYDYCEPVATPTGTFEHGNDIKTIGFTTCSLVSEKPTKVDPGTSGCNIHSHYFPNETPRNVGSIIGEFSYLVHCKVHGGIIQIVLRMQYVPDNR